MAKDDDDDDKLPPLGVDTDKFLEDTKKGKPRSFLLICKGVKVRYLAVRKKPVKKTEVTEAKKLGYKGDAYFGIITGRGMDLVFNLSKAEYDAEPVKEKTLKDFLEEHAQLKCRPTFQLVDVLPAIPFDEEDLKNPLIAKFMKLDETISQVLDKRPDLEQELLKRVTEIRLLLQEEAFDAAGPKIEDLIAKLKEWLSGGPGSTESSPTSSAPPPPSSTPSPSTDDPARRKLVEALNKIVQQVKEVVKRDPSRKTDLVTSVTAIKEQIDSGRLDEAKLGLIAVGKALKEVASGNGATSAKEDYEAKRDALQPRYDQALREVLGDTGKMRAVMGYALEKAEAGDYVSANKALDRLKPMVDDALAGNRGPESMGIQSGIVEKRKFLLQRFQQIPLELAPQLEELRTKVHIQVKEEDADDLRDAIAEAIDDFCRMTREEVDAGISAGNMQVVNGLKQRVLANKLIQHLLNNPIISGKEIEKIFSTALDEIEQKLVA